MVKASYLFLLSPLSRLSSGYEHWKYSTRFLGLPCDDVSFHLRHLHVSKSPSLPLASQRKAVSICSSRSPSSDSGRHVPSDKKHRKLQTSNTDSHLIVFHSHLTLPPFRSCAFSGLVRLFCSVMPSICACWPNCPCPLTLKLLSSFLVQ